MNEPLRKEAERPSKVPEWTLQLVVGLLCVVTVPAATALISMNSRQALGEQALTLHLEAEKTSAERLATMERDIEQTRSDIEKTSSDIRVMSTDIGYIKTAVAKLAEEPH